MSVSAAIKLAQGATSSAPGVALKGVAGSPVTASNGDDANVDSWAWSVVSAPPASAIVPGPVNDTPSVVFTPDGPGCYLLRLDVVGNDGSTAFDVRAFGVNQPSGRFIPAFEADAGSLNFGGSATGWDPIMRAWLLEIDALAAGGGGGGGGGVGYLPPAAPAASGNYTLATNASDVASWQPVGGYQILTFGLSGTGVAAVVEVGTSIAAVAFAGTLNFTPTALSVAWSGVATGTASPALGTSFSGSLTGGPFTSPTNGAQLAVTVSATDPAGAVHTATQVVTFAAKLVYGSLAPGSETVDQAMWNALNTNGSVVSATGTGSVNFASAFGQDQCIARLTSLGTPTFTDPSTGFTYPAASLGTASVTENGTTQAVTFWKFANPGSSFAPIRIS